MIFSFEILLDNINNKTKANIKYIDKKPAEKIISHIENQILENCLTKEPKVSLYNVQYALVQTEKLAINLETQILSTWLESSEMNFLV